MVMLISIAGGARLLYHIPNVSVHIFVMAHATQQYGRTASHQSFEALRFQN
jgi:hypothetical protein